MGQTVRYQEILCRLALIDDGLVADQAGLGLDLTGVEVVDLKTAALVHVAMRSVIGSPAVCLEWSTSRAVAAGASEDEIAELLLAIAPVAGLRRASPRFPAWPGRWDVSSRPPWRIQMLSGGPDGRPAVKRRQRWRDRVTLLRPAGSPVTSGASSVAATQDLSYPNPSSPTVP